MVPNRLISSVAFAPWLVEIFRESHGGLWKWGLDGCRGVQVHCLCFMVLLVYPLVYPFTIPPPQTEPLLHCRLPWWAEISLQRGLGDSGVEVAGSLEEGVHTELKISSPGPYLP